MVTDASIRVSGIREDLCWYGHHHKAFLCGFRKTDTRKTTGR